MADLRKAELEQILGRVLTTSESLVSEIRAQLVDAVIDNRDIVPILANYRTLFTELVTEAEIAGWILGHDEVMGKLPDEVLAEPSGAILPPLAAEGVDEPLIRLPAIEAAAEDLLSRNIVTRADFDTMRRESRRNAFTAARLDSEDSIATVRDVLAENLEATSLRNFRQALKERLDTSRLGAWHQELVFRNNIQRQFRIGHDTLAENPIVQDVLPYREYQAIDDDRARKQHLDLQKLGLSGTGVYRSDDPFWRVFSIPWAHG